MCASCCRLREGCSRHRPLQQRDLRSNSPQADLPLQSELDAAERQRQQQQQQQQRQEGPQLNQDNADNSDPAFLPVNASQPDQSAPAAQVNNAADGDDVRIIGNPLVDIVQQSPASATVPPPPPPMDLAMLTSLIRQAVSAAMWDSLSRQSPPASGSAEPAPATAAPAAAAAAAAPPAPAAAARPQQLHRILPPPVATDSSSQQATSPPPASHLDRFVLQAGSAGLDRAAAFLNTVEVNPSAHIPAAVPGGSVRQGDINGATIRDVYQISVSPPTTPPATRSEFDTLSAAITPFALALSTRRPTTPDQLRMLLEHWLSTNPILLNNSKRLVAWQAYAGQTIEYAHQCNTTAAMHYHDATILAAQFTPPRYDPVLDGAMCLAAYVQHIAPLLIKPQFKRPFQRDTAATGPSPNQPSSKRQKRSATSAPDTHTPASGSGTCSIHPHGSHSSADCKVLKQRKDAKGKPVGKKQQQVKPEPSDSDD